MTTSTATTVMTAMADRADEIMQQCRRSVITRTGLSRLPARVHGRVFSRLQQFASLPDDVKARVDSVAVYLASPAVVKRVFHPHTRSWLPAGSRKDRGVGPTTRGATLVAAIHDFMLLTHADDASLTTAQQLATLLVLSGFVSPVKEPQPRDGNQSRPMASLDEYVQPQAYYELVSSAAAAAFRGGQAKTKLSVWDVVDGATRAGSVFRRQPPSMLRGCLSLCTATAHPGREKKSYVVVNRVQHDALFVFADDVAREETRRVVLADAMVAYDPGTRSSPTYHGLQLWTDDHTEYLDFLTRADQNEWLLACLDGGARFKETHAGFQRIIASPFHSLHDVDSNGESFCQGDVFANKVVLLVNVASEDPEASLQYPELVALANYYEDDGLEVVACPCDQFLGLELPSHAQVVAHVQQTYGVRFRVLPTRDVNGPQAREPFVYCNAHLPGVLGPFTEWNFTKFLIDRRGKPLRRYETRVMPREMESDVRMLLGSRCRRLKSPLTASTEQ